MDINFYYLTKYFIKNSSCISVDSHKKAGKSSIQFDDSLVNLMHNCFGRKDKLEQELKTSMVQVSNVTGNSLEEINKWFSTVSLYRRDINYKEFCEHIMRVMSDNENNKKIHNIVKKHNRNFFSSNTSKTYDIHVLNDYQIKLLKNNDLFKNIPGIYDNLRDLFHFQNYSLYFSLISALPQDIRLEYVTTALLMKFEKLPDAYMYYFIYNVPDNQLDFIRQCTQNLESKNIDSFIGKYHDIQEKYPASLVILRAPDFYKGYSNNFEKISLIMPLLNTLYEKKKLTQNINSESITRKDKKTLNRI